MQISLNKDRCSMFYLPDSKIHLSFENPGPVEVDENLLSLNEYKQVRNAAHVGTITTTGAKITNPTIQDKPSIFKVTDYESIKIKLYETAKTVMCKPDSEILLAVASMDIVLLRASLDYEQKNLKREDILFALNARIKELGNILSSKMGLDVALTSNFKEKNLPEVEFTEEETITIQIGDQE